MKVGVIVDNDLNNDARVKRGIKILSEEGFTLGTLCYSFNGKSYEEIVPGKVIRIPFRSKIQGILFAIVNTLPIYEWIWIIYIRRFIKTFQPDVLHVHDLYMSRSAYIAVRSLGANIPIVLDLHENFPAAMQTFDWHKGWWRRLITQPNRWYKKEGQYLRYASRIIVLSRSFGDELLTRFDFLKAANIFVIPNVPDLGMMNSEIDQDLGRNFSGLVPPVFFYFGVIAARRGIFRIFNTFKKFLESGRNGSLLLIGPVDKVDHNLFQEYLNDPVIREKVTYLPWIDLFDLPSYLNLADVSLAPLSKDPQHESGIANKIFNYMYGGKPLLVSDCAPQEELVNSCQCGLSFSNDTEFLEKMIWMNDHPAERQIMGNNGKKAILEKFNIYKIKEELVSAFKFK
jgi:glycosyltransferase involved in cell wall biosynthesis